MLTPDLNINDRHVEFVKVKKNSKLYLDQINQAVKYSLLLMWKKFESVMDKRKYIVDLTEPFCPNKYQNRST